MSLVEALVFVGAAIATFILLGALARATPATLLRSANRASPFSRPVRQLGGVVAIPVLMLTIVLLSDISAQLIGFCIAMTVLWLAGMMDDHRQLPVPVRFAVQFAVSGIISYFISDDLMPGILPAMLERTLLALFLIWCMNMVNFMDGMDMMTVTGLGLPAITCAILLVSADASQFPMVLALGTASVLAGFAPYNMPPAHLYLGDSASMPLGVVAGIISLAIAKEYGLVPALCLLGYYHLDAGVTLFHRLKLGENIFRAHTSHFYQKALRAGYSVGTILLLVAAANLVLILLGLRFFSWPNP